MGKYSKKNPRDNKAKETKEEAPKKIIKGKRGIPIKYENID